ncbi:Hypothetical predicted protein [Mytilus galloprovincialis]|uniref:Uncharacterized protein n=1 Tax=Mytilus galloprovincialis TaxID=29158 RepID=A0A8B6GW83_MYTGA|nr:Hypothetical predicted protein [Mytilus galloprovincialis]
MKAKAFKSRAKGADRTKIADQFPQLAEVLELAFGEGSKIHLRLENDTRYKNPNLALTMSQAREILLTTASEKIPNIALSTCYTYTQNFRKNTYQAKRHPFGQDVNAKISLKKLPRVGMMEERANAHYCRAHVNFELEKAASEETDTLVDAKDAKGIVCSDIDPVQNIVYTKNPEITNRYVKEPLPDFVRWIKHVESNGELHYLCFEARDVIPYGDWDSKELFLPSNVISLLCELCTDIPDSVIDSAALLAWLTPVQLTDEIKKQHDKMQQGLDNDKSRERWKNHDLFKKTVADLQTEAKNAIIIYSAKQTETDLIQLIAEKRT